MKIIHIIKYLLILLSAFLLCCTNSSKNKEIFKLSGKIIGREYFNDSILMLTPYDTIFLDLPDGYSYLNFQFTKIDSIIIFTRRSIENKESIELVFYNYYNKINLNIIKLPAKKEIWEIFVSEDLKYAVFNYWNDDIVNSKLGPFDTPLSIELFDINLGKTIFKIENKIFNYNLTNSPWVFNDRFLLYSKSMVSIYNNEDIKQNNDSLGLYIYNIAEKKSYFLMQDVEIALVSEKKNLIIFQKNGNIYSLNYKTNRIERLFQSSIFSYIGADFFLIEDDNYLIYSNVSDLFGLTSVSDRLLKLNEKTEIQFKEPGRILINDWQN